jgi:hypothetical protein
MRHAGPAFASSFFLVALSLAAETNASDTTSDPTPRARAEELISSRLPVWQQRLGLQDWTVTVLMTARAELKPGTLGGIRWDKRKKTAVMSVLDPGEYAMPVEAMLKDLEFTLVHELIHLELASLSRSEASRRTEEHAVNNLTRALLSLNASN